MVKVSFVTKVEASILVSGETKRDTDMVILLFLRMNFTLVSGRMTNHMVEVRKELLKISLKDFFKKGKDMVKVN